MVGYSRLQKFLWELNVSPPLRKALLECWCASFAGGRVSENLALRQQLVALKRRHPRPSLGLFDKLFWVAARRFRSDWKQSLILVTPETVVRWSTPVHG